MQIQVNSDSNIQISDQFVNDIKADLEDSFRRFAGQLMRLEVHLGDENSHKGGGSDKRCLLEARLAGLDPIVASEHADSLDVAISGAVTKLDKLLDKTFGKLGQKKGRTSFAGEAD
jgi:ribosome-associated translation inhibitor RaiA